MSERGVFAVDRGVFDHDCFADEPFTEREAWMWLISSAAWKAKTVRIGKFVADLKRGQAAFSVRFLADKWQWSKSRVDRFLGRLENRDMIGTQSGTGITVITIINYNQYQRVSIPDRDSNGTQTETAAGQQRDKEENIKNIKTDSEANASGAEAPIDVRTELFRRGLGTLARISGKTPTSVRSLVGKWLKACNDEAIHVLAAIDDAETDRVADPIPWIEARLRPKFNTGPRNAPTAPNGLAAALGKLRENIEQPSGGQAGRGPPPRLLSHG